MSQHPGRWESLVSMCCLVQDHIHQSNMHIHPIGCVLVLCIWQKETCYKSERQANKQDCKDCCHLATLDRDSRPRRSSQRASICLWELFAHRLNYEDIDMSEGRQTIISSFSKILDKIITATWELHPIQSGQVIHLQERGNQYFSESFCAKCNTRTNWSSNPGSTKSVQVQILLDYKIHWACHTYKLQTTKDGSMVELKVAMGQWKWEHSNLYRTLLAICYILHYIIYIHICQ